SAFDSQKLLTWFSDDGSSYIHTIPSSTSPGEVRVETWCRVECIGEGAYGKVHREVCTERGMVRAVKVIKKACLTNPTASFETELSALTRMGSHPNYFVQLFGWFQDDASFYIAMEYMQCGDLNTMIIEFDGLSRDQIRTASKQLLLGLEIMHGLGFCHRDLKPQNILVVKWYPLKVKIADFGTTKVAGAKTPLTTFIGTPDYLAPEILDPVDVGCEIYEYTNAVDIWSLGCLVHAMATKQPPFPGRRGLTRYTSGTSPFPGKELESEMRRFIISLMRPLPHDRPTATQALEDPWLHP
ncbi:kinase-like domain-containing protein, partial [Morchella snyderi]